MELDLKRTATKNWPKMLLTFFTTFTLTIIGMRTWQTLRAEVSVNPNPSADDISSASDENNTDNTGATSNPMSQATRAFVDLQPIVDQWLTTTSADVGIVIYDLDYNRIAAAHQADEAFNIASIYKLFYAYSGYRQIDQNPQLADQPYVTTNDYRADNYTFGQCLDLIIRESYNGCADFMIFDTNQVNQANKLTQELELDNTSLAGITSTANDLTKLLRLYWQHPDLSNASWQKLTDSLLNQPIVAIDDERLDWRGGLPAGFNHALVYDKVGWLRSPTDEYWIAYADAAILDFPTSDRHYTFVVLTQDLEDASRLSQLGSLIEAAILNNTNF